MRSVVALAVADVLLLVAASAGALAVRSDGGDPFTRRVVAQPWPARVTPTGPWSASLEGSGPRFTMTAMAGAIPDALPEASFRLPARTAVTSRTTNLTPPDGSVWHPKGAFRLDAAGPLAFTSVQARGDVVDVGVDSLQSVLAPAGAAGVDGRLAGGRLHALGRLGVQPRRDNCFRACPVRIRWTNTGWATSQIMEAEGIGPGHLGGGDDISSTQQPRGTVDRGLSTKSGTQVVLVLRGNFPEVRVPLAIR